MKTVCVQTVGKGNVIKMKQKKTEDSIKRTAKPSVRKVGTMLGSGALAVLMIITESDVRGEGRVLYNFEWRDTETGKPLGDGSHIIYANAAYHAEGDSSELARLMHDFRCSNPSEMNYELLAEKARFFKETEEGVSHMCKLNEDMRNEAAREAATEAAMIKSAEIALNLLSLRTMSYEEIANVTGLTLEDVKELA